MAAETTQLNVRVSRVLAERIERATAAAGVKRSEWVRARLVEAADEAERHAAQRALGSADPAPGWGGRTGAS